VIFAVIIGVIVTAILFYVSGAAISVLLWVGLAVAVLLLVAVLYIVTRTGNSSPTPIARCLFEYGNFLAISIIGTIITAAIALALSALLVPTVTTFPVLALVFLFGFFFGGMLISLLFVLICVFSIPGTFNASSAENNSVGPIPYRP